MIDNSQNQKVQEIFKDHKGNRWYSLVNPLQVSALRGIAAAKAKRFVDMMITEGELKRLISEQKAAAKAMDVVKVYAIVNEIDIRLNFLAEERSIIDLVCIYFFLQDEDPEIPSEAHNSRKAQLIADDVRTRTFFLSIGKGLTDRFNNISEADLLSYLEENKAFAERVSQFFSSSLGTSMTL